MESVKLTPEQVRLAYYLLLGREPESEEIVSYLCDVHRDLAGLRAGFIASEEFLSLHRFPARTDEDFIPRVAKGIFPPIFLSR